MKLPVLDDRGLCSVCGLREGHREWCADICERLATDTTTVCAVVGCNHVVPRRELCRHHKRKAAA